MEINDLAVEIADITGYNKGSEICVRIRYKGKDYDGYLLEVKDEEK